MSCSEANEGELGGQALFDAYAHTRDRAIREELILRHLQLVARVTRKFAGNHHPLEDLLQVGYIALIKAIDRYDPARGIDFQAYAVPTIQGEVRRYLRDKANLVRLPRQVQEQQRILRRESERLTQQLGREPTTGELAAAANLSPNEVLALQAQMPASVVSLDHQAGPVDEESTVAGIAYLGQVDRDLEQVEQRYDLACAMAELTERERAIMYLHFFQDLPQAQIGERLRLSQMHVSRLQRDALHRLKGGIEGQTNPDDEVKSN